MEVLRNSAFRATYNYREMEDMTDTNRVKNTSNVRVFLFHYDRLSTTVIRDKPTISMADLLSKIGALFSLWLGFRVMSLLQFFYYSYWALQGRGTVQAEPVQSNSRRVRKMTLDTYM